MTNPPMHHIVPIGASLGGLTAEDAYEHEARSIAIPNPTFVRVMKPLMADHGLKDKSNHKLVADQRGRLYWWPSWLTLTTSSGLLKSIATNYQHGHGSADELHAELVSVVFNEIGKRPIDHAIPATQVLQSWVKSALLSNSNNLSPSRTQVITSPDWQVRLLISDSPRLDFASVAFEAPSQRRHRHPFPLEWIMKKFEGAETPSANIGRDAHPASSKLDVLLGDNREHIQNFLSSETRLLKRALVDSGLDETMVEQWSNKERLKVMMAALGYAPERRMYYSHFQELAMSTSMTTTEMLKLVERRTVEVYHAWKRAFMQVLETDREGFFELLNHKRSRTFSGSSKATLGAVRSFIDAHQDQIHRDSEYARWLKLRIPPEMLQLVDTPTYHRMMILEFMRNKGAHPPSMDPDEYLRQIKIASDYVRWDVLPYREWDSFTTQQRVSEFFHGFFGDEQNPCRAPTLMEVVRFEMSALGTRAVLLCLRNGTEHHLRLDEDRKIERYDEHGLLIQSNNDREASFVIGQRMYVLPTTNPTLVDPVLMYA
jgi:hypothetical protein